MKKRWNNLLRLSLAGAALLAAPAPASADIIWSGERDVWLAINEFNPGYILNLDLNEDSTTDFIIQWDWPVAMGNLVVKPQLGLNGVVNRVAAEVRAPSTIYKPFPFSSDVLIGNVLIDGRQWSSRDHEMVVWMAGSDWQPHGVGPWGEPYGPIDHMYMGVEFDAADGIHYGWVEMSVPNSPEAYVHSWAYNTVPGESILTGAVPEPATVLLFGIGGLSAWVLRRNQSSKPWENHDR